MTHKQLLLQLGLLGIMTLAAAGCTADRKEPFDWQSPREEPVTPGPNKVVPPPPAGESATGESSKVVDPVRQRLQGRLTDAEKQSILQDSLLALQRVIISSEERLELSAGPVTSTAARDLLTNRLSEVGFNVIETADRLGFSPGESRQDQFRVENDCNLVFLVQGEAKRADKFGNFWSFASELKGKVLNLTTHQVIASRTIRQRGKRATDEVRAAEDAHEAAAADLATYLTDEVARKWEVTSLVKVRLVVTGLGKFAKADDLRAGLQSRVGVYYVSLEYWDDDSETATYELLCRFDVERFIPVYVDELRHGRIRIEERDRLGEVIRAKVGILD